MIAVNGDRMEVSFERFDLSAYELFLKTKQLPESVFEFDAERETYRMIAPARFASLLGAAAVVAEKPLLPFSSYLFDYQTDICRVALLSKRYAAWWDCGLGKTPLALEYARQAAALTGRRGLILTLKDLVGEYLDQARKFYGRKLQLVVLRTRADLIAFCKGPKDGAIGITNYEKFIGPGVVPNDGIIHELSMLAFLIADESSVLKSGGGVIKWNLIHSAKGIEYKLSLTATPAPNDIMEYASQAGFLEKLRTEGEILWTFFKRDKNGKWEVKPHALEAFYRFMASWSIYLRSPARYGWADNLKNIPEPEFHEHKIEITKDQVRMAAPYLAAKRAGNLTDNEVKLGVVERSKLAQIAKGFVYSDAGTRRCLSRKPGIVAQLAEAELARGRQVLIWTEFDEETAILQEILGGADREVLTGSVKPEDRKAIIDRFRRGGTRALITRADLLGFGQNFQFCEAMIFSAFTDSYEAFYQAVRRSYRYGQCRRVQIHIPYVPELEGQIRDNLMRKAANFERDTQVQEDFYIAAMKDLSLRAA